MTIKDPKIFINEIMSLSPMKNKTYDDIIAIIKDAIFFNDKEDYRTLLLNNLIELSNAAKSQEL